MVANNKVSASIASKGDKYYIVITYYLDGKRKQKWEATGLSVSGNNKRNAEAKRKELIIIYQDKLAKNGNKMLFSEYIKQWLEKTKSTISESTYYEYKKLIHNNIAPYFQSLNIPLCDLKPYHIQDYYSHKMEQDGVSANTIHHYHANIHKALSFAVKMEHISSNPADKVELPQKAKHIADYYTADELKTVLEKAKGTQIEMVVKLAAWFGLRRGEIIGLRWSSIDFEQGILSITGVVKDKGKGSKNQNLHYEATAKTAASLRSFPMSKDVSNYLMQLKAQQATHRLREGYNHAWDDFVCVRPNGDLLPLEYVTRAFPKLCQECGLRRLKLHELRHTNISLLLAEGAGMKELQEWAGHSSYSTTANTYSHVQVQSKNRLMTSIDSILRN